MKCNKQKKTCNIPKYFK